MNDACKLLTDICLRFNKCDNSCVNLPYEGRHVSLDIKDKSKMLHNHCSFLWDKCFTCNKFAVECNILLINDGITCKKNCLYCDYYFEGCDIRKYKNKNFMPGYLQRKNLHKDYK